MRRGKHFRHTERPSPSAAYITRKLRPFEPLDEEQLTLIEQKAVFDDMIAKAQQALA